MDPEAGRVIFHTPDRTDCPFTMTFSGLVASPASAAVAENSARAHNTALRDISVPLGSPLPPHAQLLAPDLGGDFFGVTGFELAEMEGPELYADEARDLHAQMLHQPLHFAVLAFLQRHMRPGIHTLHAFEIGNDGAVFHAVDHATFCKLVELFLADFAEQPQAIFAVPSRGRKFEPARHGAVIGEQQ